MSPEHLRNWLHGTIPFHMLSHADWAARNLPPRESVDWVYIPDVVRAVPEQFHSRTKLLIADAIKSGIVQGHMMSRNNMDASDAFLDRHLCPIAGAPPYYWVLMALPEGVRI